MSEKILKEENSESICESKTDDPSNGVIKDPQIRPVSDGIIENNEVEPGNLETEYIETESLADLDDADRSLSTLLARLDSKNWVILCEALNDVRRLSVFHKETLLPILADVITLLVKSLRNPRSAVCKTAIMTSADMFKVYSDHIIDSFDPMLVQLLLKSSQDKRFVCEAAEKALLTMTTWVSPTLLLAKLQPYLTHKNPRVRSKASICFCRSVPHLGIEGIKAYGLDKLIEVAASQLSDKLPESREAARALALELRTAYQTFLSPATSESEIILSLSDSWEGFCQANLSPLSAQAILRITSTTRDNMVLGC